VVTQTTVTTTSPKITATTTTIFMEARGFVMAVAAVSPGAVRKPRKLKIGIAKCIPGEQYLMSALFDTK